MTRAQLKLVVLSSLGGLLEIYDFVIFAVFSATIGQAFFPSHSETASLLGVYAVFAVGYFIRPVGGVLFSHFGDKYGRKNTFALSISMMATATLLMSLVPNYNSIGLSATLIFLCLRLLQGLAISGEIPGAITYVSEHVKERPGLACGLIICFLNMGILVADLVYTILGHLLTNAQFTHYAWRIAFFLGGVFAFFSFHLRKNLHETPLFKAQEKTLSIPIKVLMQSHWGDLCRATLITGLTATLVSMYLLYLPSYMENILNIPKPLIGKLNLWHLLLFTLISPAFSFLSDHVNKRRFLMLATVLNAVMSIIFFYGLAHQRALFSLMTINAIVISTFMGTYCVFIAGLFPTLVRYSGIGVSYNVGFALFAGLVPFLVTLFIHLGYSSLTPAAFISVACLLAFIALSGTQKQLCESAHLSH